MHTRHQSFEHYDQRPRGHEAPPNNGRAPNDASWAGSRFRAVTRRPLPYGRDRAYQERRRGPERGRGRGRGRGLDPNRHVSHGRPGYGAPRVDVRQGGGGWHTQQGGHHAGGQEQQPQRDYVAGKGGRPDVVQAGDSYGRGARCRRGAGRLGASVTQDVSTATSLRAASQRAQRLHDQVYIGPPARSRAETNQLWENLSEQLRQRNVSDGLRRPQAAQTSADLGSSSTCSHAGLDNNVVELKKTIAMYESQVATLQNTVQTLRTQLQGKARAFKSTINELNEKLDRALQRAATAEGRAAEADQFAFTLRQELDEARRHNQETSNRCKELVKKLSGMSELQAYVQKLEEIARSARQRRGQSSATR